MIDLHCDTLSVITEKKENLWQNSGQWDVLRARSAGVSLQVLALFAMPEDVQHDWETVTQQAEWFMEQREQQKIQEKTLLIQQREDIEQCLKEEKMGILLHLEGGDALGKNLDRLAALEEWGVRSMGLTWNYSNALAAGALDMFDTGLSAEGKQCIYLMNERKILLDLSHASEKTFFQALETTKRPAYVSHADIYELCPHPRNLKDEQIKAVADQNGVIGLTYYKEFLTRGGRASLNHLLDHMAYTADLAGCGVLALGSDFDGAQDMLFTDIMGTAVLREQMQKRGFYPDEIEQIMEGNARRFLQENL